MLVNAWQMIPRIIDYNNSKRKLENIYKICNNNNPIQTTKQIQKIKDKIQNIPEIIYDILEI